MFLKGNDIDKLPELLNDKNIDHIIINDPMGRLKPNLPEDYEPIDLPSVIRKNIENKQNEMELSATLSANYTLQQAFDKTNSD